MAWLERYKTALLCLCIGVCLFVFFNVFFFGHLQFLEQYQLLLFTAQYIGDLFSRPGGLSDFLGRFFTQFCYIRQAGALSMTLLFLCLLLSSLYTVKHFSKSAGTTAVLVPAALLVFLTNEYAQVSFVVAIALAQLLFLSSARIKGNASYLTCTVLSAVVGYWLIGPASLMFVALVVVNLLFFRRKNGLLFSAILLAVHFGCTILAYRLLHYRLHTMLLGVDYVRYSASTPAIMWICYLAPLTAVFFSCIIGKRINWKLEWLSALLLSGGAIAYFYSDTVRSEEFKQMDYWVRCQKWDRIIKMAETTRPRSLLAVVYVNLALGMKGELSSRVLQFPLVGTSGLLNDWKRDCISAVPLAEVWYRLGNMNTGLRYTMEAMEANTDTEKSGRALERMAEINLINGDYAVAKKYCHILLDSWFYRSKAQRILNMIENPQLLEQNPEYSYMRRVRYKDDFIFNIYKNHPEEAIRLLGTHDENRLAREYYIVWRNFAATEKRVFQDEVQVR